MNQFNSEQVRKIWQRVQGQNAEMKEFSATGEQHFGISEAIAREQNCAAMYSLLTKKVPSHIRSQINRLMKEERQHTAALRGICAVTEGGCPIVRLAPAENAPVPILLRRCYGQKLQAIAEYEKRISDPRHGSVFRKMTEEEQNQCRILLQLIGSLEKK